MGKASSAKKVAKAARAGGRTSGKRERSLLFPGIIAGIVIAGLGLVVYARTGYQDDAIDVAPTRGDHWHAALGVNVCGEWQQATLGDFEGDGIHSHATDSLIHIHPFFPRAQGENATLGVFLDGTAEAGILDVDEDELQLMDDAGEEHTWNVDEDECDGEKAEIVVARWRDAAADSAADVFSSGFDDLRFRGDGEAYAIYFRPEGADDEDIEKPEQSISELAAPSDDYGQTPSEEEIPEELLPEGGIPSTTAPAAGATTVPGQPAEGATTTVPPQATTTVPPAEGSESGDGG